MAAPSQYQGMPLLSTPVIGEDGMMNVTWYRFFQSLYIKSGLGPYLPSGQANRIRITDSAGRVITSTLYPGGANASCAIATDVDRYLNVYDIQTGQFSGRIRFTDEF